MVKTDKPYLIAFDMDGTLLNERKSISFKTRKYLQRLAKQGHKIILASGRPSRALYKYYNQLKIDTPMICYNGAYYFSPVDKNFKAVAFEFPRNVIIEVIEAIKPYVYNVMCETDDEIWIDKPDSYLDKFFWYKNMKLHYGELKDTLNKDPMTCIVQTPFEYRETKEIEKILEKYPQIAARFWTGSPYFELHYKSTSKASALKTIGEYYNIPKERTIAFGDSTNDIEMFEYAGISVAMKNCKGGIEQKATTISIKDNDHNGIYHTLKNLLK